MSARALKLMSAARFFSSTVKKCVSIKRLIYANHQFLNENMKKCSTKTTTFLVFDTLKCFCSLHRMTELNSGSLCAHDMMLQERHLAGTSSSEVGATVCVQHLAKCC